MGKITEALKRVKEEREALRQAQKTADPARENNDQPIDKKVPVRPSQKKSAPQPLSLRKISIMEKIKDNIDRLKISEFNISEEVDSSGIDPRVVTYYDYFSPVSEQYRILRTNIKTRLSKIARTQKPESKNFIKQAKVFTVTSSLHSEGKSISCINMAVAFAKDVDSNVLLIDCDLRNGSVGKYLNIHESPGISDILSGSRDNHRDAIHATGIPNLYVMPIGDNTAHPSELLGSKKMRNTIEKLKSEDFSYIIIDTPPLFPFTDAGVVGAHTDGVVLVVQAYRTQTKVVERAIERLDHAHSRLLGTVLTQSDHYVPDIYGYHYYYKRVKDDGRAEKADARFSVTNEPLALNR